MSTPDIPASGATPGSGEPTSPGKKLDSWGEIASYLGREVRTGQRWERTEGLPVHRHEHKKKSTVYAFAGELDEWIRKRQPKDDPAADDAFAYEQELSGTDSPIDIVEPPVASPAPVPTAASVKTPAAGKRVIMAIFHSRDSQCPLPWRIPVASADDFPGRKRSHRCPPLHLR